MAFTTVKPAKYLQFCCDSSFFLSCSAVFWKNRARKEIMTLQVQKKIESFFGDSFYLNQILRCRNVAAEVGRPAPIPPNSGASPLSYTVIHIYLSVLCVCLFPRLYLSLNSFLLSLPLFSLISTGSSQFLSLPLRCLHPLK